VEQVIDGGHGGQTSSASTVIGVVDLIKLTRFILESCGPMVVGDSWSIVENLNHSFAA
jgi:hypothetical protein